MRAISRAPPRTGAVLLRLDRGSPGLLPAAGRPVGTGPARRGPAGTRAARTRQRPAVAATGLAAAAGARSLPRRTHHLTVVRHRAMRSVAPRLRLTNLGQAVEQLQVVKDGRDLLSAHRRRDRRQALGELPGVHPGRPHRTAPRPGTGAPPGRPRRRRAPPSPSVGTGPNSGRAATGHRPARGGGRLPLRLPGRDLRGYRCEIGRTFVIGTSPADSRSSYTTSSFAAQQAGRRPSHRRRLPRRGPRRPPGTELGGVREENLPTLTGQRCGTRNRRGPAVGPRGHG
ncbi:peptidase M24 family protein [Streptomyces thinghirensis]|nr:peptidase M24 family protein [Streptomyces thinghirensis]